MRYVPVTERNETEAAFESFASQMTGGIAPVRQRVGYQGENREWDVFWRPQQSIWCSFPGIPMGTDSGAGLEPPSQVEAKFP